MMVNGFPVATRASIKSAENRIRKRGGGARECEVGGQTQINRLQERESEKREVKRLLSFVGLGDHH